MGIWFFSLTPGGTGGQDLLGLVEGPGGASDISLNPDLTIGGVIEQLQNPATAVGTLRGLLPPDSPINDFLDAYNDVDEALKAAAEVGLVLPDTITTQLADAGVGLYGSNGSWTGAGPAQGWSSANSLNTASGLIGGALNAYNTWKQTNNVGAALASGLTYGAFYAVNPLLGAAAQLFMGMGGGPSQHTTNPMVYYKTTSPLGANLQIQNNLHNLSDVADYRVVQDNMYALDGRIRSFLERNNLPDHSLSTVLNAHSQSPADRLPDESLDDWVARVAKERFDKVARYYPEINTFRDIGYAPITNPAINDSRWDPYYYVGGTFNKNQVPSYSKLSIPIGAGIPKDKMWDGQFMTDLWGQIQNLSSQIQQDAGV